ncbi:uncharacterized protein LOC106667957 isoform X5 [Cimex lectularius]|uniref:Uncharacterized protein n=1 Tax=Cimex lectularius TaxID=79782 RepID=A0A8I6RUT4_CIMLE|nr:uncharacterized protein LOC106667957 isoform X5 [Cimex lectularius]
MPNIFKWRTLVIIENKCVLCIKDFYFSNFILADKMNCIRVRTCCFMCSVTTGSKIFGWVITLASTAGIIYLAATFNDVFTPPVSIAGLTFAGLVLFGGVTLLVGIYSESSNAVLGALIVLVLVFLGAVALAVPFAEGYITGKVSFMKTLPSFAGIILLILFFFIMCIVINSKLLIMREKKLANDSEEQQTSGEDTAENEGPGDMLLISCPIYSKDSQNGAQCVVRKVKDVPRNLPFLTTDPIPAKNKMPDNVTPVRRLKYLDTDRMADYRRLKNMKLKRMKESIPDLDREISRTDKPDTRRKIKDNTSNNLLFSRDSY